MPLGNNHRIKTRHGRSFWGIGLSNFKLDVTKAGETKSLSGSVVGTVVVGVIMAAFMSFPLLMAMSDGVGSEDRDALIVAVVPAVILTITGIVATVNVFKRATITVLDDALDIEWQTISGRGQRVIRFAEFAGVLDREVVVKRKNSSTTYQILELAHPEKNWSVPLQVSTGRNSLRQTAEEISKALGVPLLRQDGDTITMRDSDTLDQTISERVASGELKDSFDPNSAPPKGLRVDYGKKDGKPRIKIWVEAPRLPVKFLMLFVIIGTVAPLAALIDGDPDAILGLAITVVMFVGLPLFLIRMDARTPRHLLISTEALTWQDDVAARFNLQSTGPLSLKMNEVEDVLVQSDGFMNPVIIAADKGQIKIAQGINKEAADWLRSYIISAIANAPKADNK